MELALAGAGTASVVHALAADALGVPIVAVASRSEALATERAAQVGARAVPYESLPAGADAVLVCTPPDRHRIDIDRALDAEAPVLVERPLASRLVDADAIVARGARVLLGENLAHSPIITAVRRHLATIGAIGFIEVRLLSPRPTWGSYLERERGGGVLFDLGSSALALALLLAGEFPMSIEATVTASDDLDVDDRAEVRLSFPSGANARVEVNWRSSAAMWDVQVSSETDVVRAELLPIPAIEHNGDPLPLPARRFDVDPHVELLGHVAQLEALQRVVDGEAPTIDAAFGRNLLELVCAAYASAAAGARLSLPFTARRDATPIDHWRGTP